jgi:hypothetical protein
MLARPSAFKALIAGGGLVLLPTSIISRSSHIPVPCPFKPLQSAALAAVAVTAAGGTPVFILKAKPPLIMACSIFTHVYTSYSFMQSVITHHNLLLLLSLSQ